jgi:hypothetical protein
MILYKIVAYVPLSHADPVREAIGMAGAGRVGNYGFCSFSSRGMGRFRPEAGAQPAIGLVGRYEEVEEERIEVTCPKNLVADTIAAIKRVHPYEQVVLDVYELASWSIG